MTEGFTFHCRVLTASEASSSEINRPNFRYHYFDKKLNEVNEIRNIIYIKI